MRKRVSKALLADVGDCSDLTTAVEDLVDSDSLDHTDQKRCNSEPSLTVHRNLDSDARTLP